MAQTPALRLVSKGESLNYTPTGAVTAGDVIIISGTPFVVSQDIAANEQGDLLMEGLFKFPKDTSTFSLGDAVYWNATGSPVTGTASSGAATSTVGANTFLGLVTADALTGDDYVHVSFETTFPLARFTYHTERLTATTASLSILNVPRKMKLTSVNYVHATGSTSGTLQVEKCTGTTAAGSGTVLLTATIDLSATTVANTVTAGTLISTAASLTFAAGDRVALKIAGTMTSLVGGIVTLQFQYV